MCSEVIKISEKNRFRLVLNVSSVCEPKLSHVTKIFFYFSNSYFTNLCTPLCMLSEFIFSSNYPVCPNCSIIHLYSVWSVFNTSSACHSMKISSNSYHRHGYFLNNSQTSVIFSTIYGKKAEERDQT